MNAEEASKDLLESVRVAVDDWIDGEESSARRVEGQVIIEEEELVGKVAVMVGMTADSFS